GGEGGVIARGGQAGPVGAEGETDDVAAVAGEGEQFLTTRAVPHPDRLIPTGRGQPRPVGAEGDTAGGGAVAADGEDRPAAGQVPDRPVDAGGEPPAVRVERHAVDRGGRPATRRRQ